MDLTISTICFLRLVTALLSLTEAIRNRPDVEQSSVGVCWTVAFFAFLISIALESKQPNWQVNFPSTFSSATCLEYVFSLLGYYFPSEHQRLRTVLTVFLLITSGLVSGVQVRS